MQAGSHFHGDHAEMQTGHRLDSHRHSRALAYQHMLSAWLRTFPLAVLMFRASLELLDHIVISAPVILHSVGISELVQQDRTS